MNHPHLSAHIDETDEDALSYMTNLEVKHLTLYMQSEYYFLGSPVSFMQLIFIVVIKQVETFKNNKLGYRICFHFRRNPFFQNKVIVKELHLGIGGGFNYHSAHSV